ncbi:ribonuclease H-like domain-containing protein [Hypoxylon sp. FL1284]|nr:ribonuclease H-like domain-containing protein [Hypoxylon sp. FL1284]
MDNAPKTGAKFDRHTTQWPLAYQLKPPEPGGPPHQWWNHFYYRGSRNRAPQILYSDSLNRSESIARTFLDEPVIGFDMEWPMWSEKSARLQEKIALIQIACERRIALFHVALHDGETVDDIIAPSLRRIIESPTILKTGVAILSADFKKLKEEFDLNPRGAFELSHLHNLVRREPQGNKPVTTKLCALSKQVEHHLGLPLYKGSVRQSDWSLPLTQDQRIYAANDAYAGFMLFHCMNAKRLATTPVPPFPKPAESYLPFKLPPIGLVQFESAAEETQNEIPPTKPFATAHYSPPSNTKHSKGSVEGGVFRLQKAEYSNDHVKKRTEQVLSRTISSTKSSEPVVSSKLYKNLVFHRRQIAIRQGVPAYIVATNKILEELTRGRPVSEKQLLKIHGVGTSKVQKYGKEWLRIIAEDITERPPENTPLQPTIPNLGSKIQDAFYYLPANNRDTTESPRYGSSLLQAKSTNEDKHRVEHPEKPALHTTIEGIPERKRRKPTDKTVKSNTSTSYHDSIRDVGRTPFKLFRI